MCSFSLPVFAVPQLIAPFLLVYFVNSLVYFVNSLAFPLREQSKFYTFSLANSALNSVVRPLPVVFNEPRRQKTAKDRRKSSSDRPLEIRRHEFHCVESAPTSEITKDKVSLRSPKSLYLRTTTPNKSLAAQRNVRSLNLVIRTVSDSLDIVSTPVTIYSLTQFFVGYRIRRVSLSCWISYDRIPPSLAPINVTTLVPDCRLFNCPLP